MRDRQVSAIGSPCWVRLAPRLAMDTIPGAVDAYGLAVPLSGDDDGKAHFVCVAAKFDGRWQAMTHHGGVLFEDSVVQVMNFPYVVGRLADRVRGPILAVSEPEHLLRMSLSYSLVFDPEQGCFGAAGGSAWVPVGGIPAGDIFRQPQADGRLGLFTKGHRERDVGLGRQVQMAAEGVAWEWASAGELGLVLAADLCKHDWLEIAGSRCATCGNFPAMSQDPVVRELKRSGWQVEGTRERRFDNHVMAEFVPPEPASFKRVGEISKAMHDKIRTEIERRTHLPSPILAMHHADPSLPIPAGMDGVAVRSILEARASAALKPFVGRKATAETLEEATAAMRRAIMDLPPGMVAEVNYDHLSQRPIVTVTKTPHPSTVRITITPIPSPTASDPRHLGGFKPGDRVTLTPNANPREHEKVKVVEHRTSRTPGGVPETVVDREGREGRFVAPASTPAHRTVDPTEPKGLVNLPVPQHPDQARVSGRDWNRTGLPALPWKREV